MIVEIVSVVFGILGVAFGIRCYRELWKWARQCQNARIAVAYKRKVKLQAPLVEWLMWCNQLERDQASAGRVVYTLGGTSIAITRPVIPPGKVRQTIRRVKPRRGNVSPAPVKEGKWAATDQTKKVAA